MNGGGRAGGRTAGLEAGGSGPSLEALRQAEAHLGAEWGRLNAAQQTAAAEVVAQLADQGALPASAGRQSVPRAPAQAPQPQPQPEPEPEPDPAQQQMRRMEQQYQQQLLQMQQQMQQMQQQMQ